MPERLPPGSRAEREARRALLEDSLRDLAASDDPDRTAGEVMRALDAYVDDAVAARSAEHREPPVTDFAGREKAEVRWATWFVAGGAVIATAVVAIVMSGGWPAGLAILAVWTLALIVMTST